MPLPSAIKLFIDPRTGSAFGNFSGTSSLTNPVFTLGDTATIELYLVEDTGLSAYPRQEIGFPTSPGIKVAVGAIDESPLAGTWTLSYGGNTTTALAYNATPAAVQAALNLLASITAAGGVTVSQIGDNYNIVFNANGARTELTTNGAALIPLSAATVATLQTGDANKPAIYLVHLQRTVAGLATSFSPTAASAITVEALTAWDGTKATYRVSISPDPKGGSFSLAFDAQTGTDVSTKAISVGATALDVQNALSIGALADGKVSVTQVKAYAYDVSVTVQPGTNGLTADDAGLLSFSGYKGEINLNTAEAISLLDGAPSVETTLEVEITSDSKTLTVLQIPCTLHNAVIDAGAVQPLVLDTYLSQTTADGRYFKLSQNLADGTAATMRGNLGVYSTGEVDTALALKANTSHTHTIANVTGLQTALDGKAALSHTHAIADVTGLQTALDGKAATSHTQAISTITGLQTALDGKANLTSAAFTGDVTIAGRAAIGGGLAVNPAHKLAIHSGNIVFSAGFGLAFGDGTTQTTAATTPNLSGYALLSGATFTGKANFTSVSGAAGINIGIGGTSASATTNGDLWISTGGSSLNFRDGQGSWRQLLSTSTAGIIDVSSTTAALRVTQRGAGSALVVEDQTTPDFDALIIDANGNLGIGVSNNPGSVWSGSSYKMEVWGGAKMHTLKVDSYLEVGNDGDLGMSVRGGINFPQYGGTINGFTTQSNPMGGNFSNADYPEEIVIRLNGSIYAVPARQIT